MLKASFVTAYFKNNELFDPENKILNRDNFLYFLQMLKKEFRKHDIDLSTQDINPPQESQIVLYNGYTSNRKVFKYNENQYLLMLESPHINIGHDDPSQHKAFKKIFTWNDSYIDNKRYFKVNYSYKLPTDEVGYKKEGRRDFCCMIAGNKKTTFPKELYSERIRAIRWFEKNHPDDFDLYGTGWNSLSFPRESPLRYLNKFSIPRKPLAPSYSSYRGRVASKKETLEKYKFAIAYENIAGYKGYITEKIFDCLFSGVMPIYLGADNISDHIPQGCYIDKRKFTSYENLYDHLKSISDHEYRKFIKETNDFLFSDKSKQFDATYFAFKIVSEITKDISL